VLNNGGKIKICKKHQTFEVIGYKIFAIKQSRYQKHIGKPI